MSQSQQSSPTNPVPSAEALTPLQFTQTVTDIASVVKAINQLVENLSYSHLSQKAPETYEELTSILADTVRRVAGLMNRLGESTDTGPIPIDAATWRTIIREAGAELSPKN